MARHGVPTARFHTSESLDDALRVVRSGEFGWPVVLKADGLAAGKGVVIAEDRDGRRIGRCRRDGGAEVRRRGRNAGHRRMPVRARRSRSSSLSDGVRAVPIGSAQDHKRIFDDDRGPNTGGMGAFAPSPLVDAPLVDRVMREIVEPVIAGMAQEGHPFRGFLFVGLMLTPAGPKVIEFNVRLGDPETQAMLPLIDEPLLPLLVAGATGRLRQSSIRIGRDCMVGVVLASRGYPESAESGQVISGIDAAERLPGVAVYHAGTAPSRRATGDGGRTRADRGRPGRRFRRSHLPRLRRRRADLVRRHAVPARHRPKGVSYDPLITDGRLASRPTAEP